MSRVLVTGATGFVGHYIVRELKKRNHQVAVVTRNQSSAEKTIPGMDAYLEFDLNRQELPASVFEGVTSVIHLAGETIDGRWSKEKKKKIYESRILSTGHLLKNIPSTVRTILTASAQGIYGDRKDEVLIETSPLGNGFLPTVCKDWEAPFHQLLKNDSLQVGIFRFGLVLSQEGGALKKMLPFFQKNLGSRLGSGEQWISWIHVKDLAEVFMTALADSRYRGVFNASTDHPVRNKEWTEKLCQHLRVLHMPAVPEFMLKLTLGEMSELVLSSARMKPQHLLELGFSYQFPDLDSAFSFEFKSPKI